MKKLTKQTHFSGVMSGVIKMIYGFMNDEKGECKRKEAKFPFCNILLGLL